MTESQIVAALNLRYAPPEWVFLLQVPSGTGANKSRTADAVAMNMYPSRGLEVHGFEFKVSRSDWLRELKQPDKAEEICRFCDRWWIVAGDKSIVKAGELPRTWGLLVPNGDGLRAEVAAPELTPQPLTRHFFAGLMRAAREVVSPMVLIEAEREKAYNAGFEAGNKRGRESVPYLSKEYERLKESVQKFEEASGIKIDGWNGGSMGAAVRVVMADGVRRNYGSLVRLQELATHIHTDIQRQMKAYEDLAQ